MKPEPLLLLLVLAGTHRAADGFMMHLATECPVAANGSVVSFDFCFVFNKNPLVCYSEQDRLFLPVDGGLLREQATRFAAFINQDARWHQRMATGRQACQNQSQALWGVTGQRRTPPHMRIVPTSLGNPTGSVRLTCHVWGFYPADVVVSWLLNGAPLNRSAAGPTPVLANGDWTYQTHVSLLTTPRPDDTFTCHVEHPSLAQPRQEEWRPGLSPGLAGKVIAAGMVLGLGLVLLIAGLVCWRWAPAPGYLPLTGHNYPGGST